MRNRLPLTATGHSVSRRGSVVSCPVARSSRTSAAVWLLPYCTPYSAAPSLQRKLTSQSMSSGRVNSRVRVSPSALIFSR